MHADFLVIGLGYAGIPLAREASLAGLAVVGLGTRHRPRFRQ
jgi:UDP-N-acetyl-D-mannosaminuronate dehydrogenase